MRRIQLFATAVLMAIVCHDGRAQTAVNLSQTVCTVSPVIGGTVVLAVALPGPAGTPLAGKPAKSICVMLDASGFRLDQSTNPPTLRALAVAAPSSTVPVFVDGETPSGAIDGVNATFRLSAVPSPSTSLHLCRNGIRQQAGLDFTVAADGSVLFAAVSIPQPGDTLLADFRH